MSENKAHHPLALSFKIPEKFVEKAEAFFEKWMPLILMVVLTGISIYCFYYYYNNGLGLAYNDARSHLNIARRVVEGLKPGMAQLGSVWLPLPHALMLPTVWNDFMWHSGMAGALPSMISFVLTGMVIYNFLKLLHVGILGRLFGVLVFVANINILYLQSTAMTELLLLGTMTAAVYELVLWHKENKILFLLRASFWVALSTLVRYDGWFLFFWSSILVLIHGYRRGKYQQAEGMFVIFCTLAGFGVFLWLLWNLLIFKDPLYFAFGPFSAHTQQAQLETAGVLATKGDWLLSSKIYWYALAYNSIVSNVILGAIGFLTILFSKKLPTAVKLGVTALMAPLVFNILALYLGHSVLFVQGISGDTWFNVRYGIMMMPSLAIFAGYLFGTVKPLRGLIIGLFCLTIFFHFANNDAVTIDDGRVGSSQKNVSEVSGWLEDNAANQEGYVLISAASHDAIIFSSNMPMKRFIHEGTGLYWESATTAPDRWARWIIMRTNDNNDLTFKAVNASGALGKYQLVRSFPFADIYELKPEYVPQLNNDTVFVQK
jgi:hypothetical protein